LVVIGIDAHKRTHTLVAVDQVGRKLAERTVRATPDGHADAAAWAARPWPNTSRCCAGPSWSATRRSAGTATTT
jgi:hypothetical protein